MIGAFAIAATTAATLGYSYFQERRKLEYDRKQKKMELQSQMESLLEDQERFQAKSGLKSPYAQKVIKEGYSKAIKRIV